MKKSTSLGWKKRYIFLAGVLAVGAATVFGDNGLLEVRKLKKERDGILAYNAAIEKENEGLEKKIKLLKTDRRYIGYIARKELGMLGKDEVLYKFDRSK